MTKSRILITATLCTLFVGGTAAATPAASDSGHDNSIRWQKTPAWSTGGDVVDMAQSLDGKHLYILTEGAVKIFNDAGMEKGALLGTIPVAPGIDKIDISPDGTKIYLLNRKTGAFTATAVVFHKEINVKNAPMIGAEDAPVSIVVFTDFQCPYCRKLPPVIAEVMEKNKGRVKLYFKNMPLISIHPQAERAARAGIAAAQQGKFWEMHDKLFAAKTLNKEVIDGFARELGLDMEKFTADAKSQETTEKLRADLLEGQRNGVDGTPYIFINGWTLGNRSAEGFQKMIDILRKEKN